MPIPKPTLPPYPVAGGKTTAQRLEAEREKYRLAAARIDTAVAEAEDAMAKRFQSDDTRVSTRQRILNTANKNRQKTLRG